MSHGDVPLIRVRLRAPGALRPAALTLCLRSVERVRWISNFPADLKIAVRGLKRGDTETAEESIPANRRVELTFVGIGI